MTDAELRGRLLSTFYDLRHSNRGWVPVSDMNLSGVEAPVSREAIGAICRQLADVGLIEWTPNLGHGLRIGSARLTGRGVDAVERRRSNSIEVRFPNKAARRPEGEHLRRDPNLIQKLLEKLEEYPSQLGDVFSLDGSDPKLAIEGYTSDQISYHLEQLREMGLIDSPGSQPMLGVIFAGLSARGHDFLDHHRVQASPPSQPAEVQRPSHKVFVVHGHDAGPRAEVARFIEKLGFEAIILHERPNKGRTLITKFREEAEGVGFAVVLMTPDDLGKAVTSAEEAKPRARQNVVFELGFFIGKLGPERVAALVKGDIETPSDFDGVVYISFDKEHWQAKLGKELKEAGYSVDWNKVMDG